MGPLRRGLFSAIIEGEGEISTAGSKEGRWLVKRSLFVHETHTWVAFLLSSIQGCREREATQLFLQDLNP
jgi:hypothetical protein